MSIQAALLDTDILSELLKQHPAVTSKARAYLAEHGRVAFSLITRYEILRGLHAKDAHAQQSAFESFCFASMILPVTDAVVEQAARLYGELYQRGELLPDADLLIAATALTEHRVLVTNNVRHFSRIRGLVLDNWRQ